ncbi:hypothetical protein Leryth_005340 [Lithospermum erythrorhizon]|nr:hypothetical protein Leryth_005340 [Lithospermum erythrorhizon]
MLRAYCNGYYSLQTLELYIHMRRIGIKPNNYSFPFVLKSCAKGFYSFQGMLVHCHVMKTGFDSDLCVAAALVNVYAKCGFVHESRKVFDEMSDRDLVCWTTMITAYERGGMATEALRLFWNMQQERFFMDGVIAISVASAIGQLGYGRNAKAIHGSVVCNGYVRDVSVGSAVLAMYAKCGEVENACLVFGRMMEKDETTWNAMLSCYTKNGLASEAFALFDKLLDSGIRPGYVTFLVMVGACALVGSKKHGKKFHDFIVKSRIKIDFALGNALMDMYAKCGDMETCIELFNEIPTSDWRVSTWNVLISGYGMHGHGRKALEMFSRMIAEGIQPDHITFTSILSACSHSGLIDEARRCFADMKKFSVNPEPKHYACLVDMLGRAGLLSEAYELIKEMGSEANDEVWGALLLACKIHGNKEFGEIAAENLFRLEPKHAGYSVLMSNLYADSSKWKEVVKLRETMKIGGLKKPAAMSLVEFPEEVCS